MLDYLELSDEHSIVEIIANKKIDGHSLIELDIRAKFGLNIVAIKRGKEVIVSPRATENVQAGDILIVIGHDDEVDRFKHFLR